MTPLMANQRKPGISRITVTIPDEMLREIEAEAEKRAEDEPGFDRLAYIREAIIEKLRAPERDIFQSPKSSNNEEADNGRDL